MNLLLTVQKQACFLLLMLMFSGAQCVTDPHATNIDDIVTELQATNTPNATINSKECTWYDAGPPEGAGTGTDIGTSSWLDFLAPHGAAPGHMLAVGEGSYLYESKTGVCGPFTFLSKLWPPPVANICKMSHIYQPERPKGYYQVYAVCFSNAINAEYFYVGAWKTLADFKTGEQCTGEPSNDCGYLLKIKTDMLGLGTTHHSAKTALVYSRQHRWYNPNITRVEDGVLFFRFNFSTADNGYRYRGKAMINLPAAAKLSNTEPWTHAHIQYDGNHTGPLQLWTSSRQSLYKQNSELKQRTDFDIPFRGKTYGANLAESILVPGIFQLENSPDYYEGGIKLAIFALESNLLPSGGQWFEVKSYYYHQKLVLTGFVQADGVAHRWVREIDWRDTAAPQKPATVRPRDPSAPVDDPNIYYTNPSDLYNIDYDRRLQKLSQLDIKPGRHYATI